MTPAMKDQIAQMALKEWPVDHNAVSETGTDSNEINRDKAIQLAEAVAGMMFDEKTVIDMFVQGAIDGNTDRLKFYMDNLNKADLGAKVAGGEPMYCLRNMGNASHGSPLYLSADGYIKLGIDEQSLYIRYAKPNGE